MPPKQRLLALAQQLLNQTLLAEAHGVLIALLTLFPQDEEALLMLGFIARERGQLLRSKAIFTQILAKNPNHVNAKASLALTLFHLEEWANAWEAFHVRFALMDKPPVVQLTRNGVTQPMPMWDGVQPIQSLLVMSEQGLGDTLQFVRFLPELVKRGIKTIFVAPKPLHHLLREVCEGVELRSQEEKGQAGVESWLPLMELPHTLKLSPLDYVAAKPYLSVNAQKQAAWAARLAPLEGLKIGICWQGNPAHSADKSRSCALENFAPLAALPFVTLISLQKGAKPACSFQEKLVCFDDLDNADAAFEDTAALLPLLDGVISVDTSLAHLAGALHVPCELLLMRMGADWRWLAREKDIIWYPHHQLYRQTTQGDWAQPIQAICERFVAQRQATSVVYHPSPPLVPALLWQEGVEKLKQLDAKTQQSEDVNELKTLLHQRLVLSEWVKAQNLIEEKPALNLP